MTTSELSNMTFEHILKGQCEYIHPTITFPPYIPFVFKNGKKYSMFLSHNLEDFVAALYVVENPQIGGWDWLRKVRNFKQLFVNFLLILSHRHQLEAYVKFIENFLLVYLGFYKPDRKVCLLNTLCKISVHYLLGSILLFEIILMYFTIFLIYFTINIY